MNCTNCDIELPDSDKSITQYTFYEKRVCEKCYKEIGDSMTTKPYIYLRPNEKHLLKYPKIFENPFKNKLPEGWNEISVTPPNELLEVIDNKGNTGIATPNYYPFKTVPNPNKTGKFTSDVVPCEPYWDGGWMIIIEDLTLERIDTIVGWRKPKSNQ